MYAAAGRGSQRRGGCGTMRASSPTGVCYSAEVAFSRLAAGPPLVRRGGIYPSRGCSRRRGVRRDEGIPPYGRFIGSAYTGKAACFRREERHVGADSISARGVRGGAGVAGRCEHRPLQGFVIAQGLRFPGWPRARRWFVGEGFIPPAGVCGGAGRADMESAPTGGCSTAGFALSRLAADPPLVVGEGFIPPAGVCVAAGRADMESAPTGGCSTAGLPVGRGPRLNSKLQKTLNSKL